MNLVKYGLKNLVPVGLDGSLHVFIGCRSVNEENGHESGSFIHGLCIHTVNPGSPPLSPLSFSSLFSSPILRRLLHII